MLYLTKNLKILKEFLNDDLVEKNIVVKSVLIQPLRAPIYQIG